MIASVKKVLLDTLACAFGAVGSEAAGIAEKTIRSTFGDGDAASIIGYPRSATIEGALFVNGVLVRSLDLNDTYIGTEPLHPSEVLPTALAVCEGTGKAAATSSRRLSSATRPALASMMPSLLLRGVFIHYAPRHTAFLFLLVRCGVFLKIPSPTLSGYRPPVATRRSSSTAARSV